MDVGRNEQSEGNGTRDFALSLEIVKSVKTEWRKVTVRPARRSCLALRNTAGSAWRAPAKLQLHVRHVYQGDSIYDRRWQEVDERD